MCDKTTGCAEAHSPGRIVAILDRPDAKTLGDIPILVDTPDRGLVVCGYANNAPKTISRYDLQELVAYGDAKSVDEPCPDLPLPGIAVGCVGDVALQELHSLDGPTPPWLPTSPGAFRVEQLRCHFVVKTCRALYEDSMRWSQDVLDAVLRRPSRALSIYAIYGVHSCDDTRAALWLTAPDKAKELAWFVRQWQAPYGRRT